eukprot:3051522-Rhodomonas_salina.1
MSCRRRQWTRILNPQSTLGGGVQLGGCTLKGRPPLRGVRPPLSSVLAPLGPAQRFASALSMLGTPRVAVSCTPVSQHRAHTHTRASRGVSAIESSQLRLRRACSGAAAGGSAQKRRQQTT